MSNVEVTDDADRAILLLLNGSPDEKALARLLATGVCDTIEKWAKAEDDMGTDSGYQIIALTGLAATVIGSMIVEYIRPDGDEHVIASIVRGLSGSLTEHVDACRAAAAAQQ